MSVTGVRMSRMVLTVLNPVHLPSIATQTEHVRCVMRPALEGKKTGVILEKSLRIFL